MAKPDPRIADVIRGAFEAWSRGELETLVAAVTRDVVIEQPPELPGAKTYRGPEGMREALQDWPSQWEDFRMHLVEVVTLDDERALAITHHSGRGRESGVEVEGDFAFLLTVKGGRLASWRMFTSREQALAAAGSA